MQVTLLNITEVRKIDGLLFIENIRSSMTMMKTMNETSAQRSFPKGTHAPYISSFNNKKDMISGGLSISGGESEIKVSLNQT